MKNKLEFVTDEMNHRWEEWETKNLTHYRWNQYDINRIPTWSWEKYNANQEQQHIWKQYRIHEDTQYNWKKYQRVDKVLSTAYYWEKHELDSIDSYPSWTKEELPLSHTYYWRKFEKNPSLAAARNIQVTILDPDDRNAKMLTGYPEEIDGEERSINFSVPADFQENTAYFKPIVTGEGNNNNTARSIYKLNVKFYIREGQNFNTENLLLVKTVPLGIMYSPELPPETIVWKDEDTPQIARVYWADDTGEYTTLPITNGYDRLHSFEESLSPEQFLQEYQAVKAAYPQKDILIQINARRYKFKSIRNTQYTTTPLYPHLYNYQENTVVSNTYSKSEINDTLWVEKFDVDSNITKMFYTVKISGKESFFDSYWLTGASEINKEAQAHGFEQGYSRYTSNFYAIMSIAISGTKYQGYADSGNLRNYNNVFYGTGEHKPADRVDENGTVHKYIANYKTKYYGSSKIISAGSYIYNGIPQYPGPDTPIHIIDGSKEVWLFYDAGEADINILGTVSSNNINAYPDNGKHSDGYWYIKQNRIDTQIGANYNVAATFIYNVDTSTLVRHTGKLSFDLSTGQWVEGAADGNEYYTSTTPTEFYQKVEGGFVKFYTTTITNKTDFTQKKYGPYAGAQEEDSGRYFQQMEIVLSSRYFAGNLIEMITTMVPDSYPLDGKEGDYWYIFTQAIDNIEQQRGEFIEDVSYLNELRYPNDGVYSQDGYWYVYQDSVIVRSPGAFVQEVRSNDITLYPGNGVYQDYWYVYNRSEIGWVKGRYLETITATTADAYPQDGYDGRYWYVFTEYTVVIEKGEFVKVIEDITDPDAYPVDGALDNYWYTRLDSYQKLVPNRYLQDVWSSNIEDYPDNDIKNDKFYKYQGYRRTPQYMITDGMLKGGISYKQEVNTSADYAPGDVGSAEIQFTIFTEPKEAQKYLNLECDYYRRMRDGDNWELVGHFTVTSAGDKTATTTQLKAYDNIIKTEAIIDEFINNKEQYPMTLQTFFTKTCEACGLTGIWDSSTVNGDFSVKHNFTTENITGRQILALVAQVAGGFAKADKEGNIVLQSYKTKDINLTKENYSNCVKAIYSVQQVDKINVATSTNDLGVTYGPGNVLYRVIDNPLLRFQQEEEILTAVGNMYNKISAVVYVPTEVSTIEPLDIECGDIIKVDDEIVYVMSRKWDGKKIDYSSKGQRYRTVETSPINGSVEALRGKSNELKRTIDETNSRLTDTEANLRSEISQTAGQIQTTITNTKSELQSQITQTSDSLTATITNTKSDLESQISLTSSNLTASITDTKKDLESQITLSAESLTTKISDTKKDLEGQISLSASQLQTSISNTKTELNSTITQTADSINSRITSQGQTVTEISQKVDGISLTYNSSNGTASITIGDITVSNLVNDEYVNQTVAGIDVTGYVRFNDLERSGATTINGSNITTGTISADRINLGGAITWSDLSSSLQDTIEGSSGGGTTDPVTGLPDYIKSTYIDATTIYSPRIVGGKLIAGDSSRGYSEMTSGGLNICASNGSKPIIGLGHLTNHYNEPFITLGIGVDSTGTDAGVIKKYGYGIWIGDSDDLNGTGNTPSRGTGIFINFVQGQIYKYINGTATLL